MQLRYEVEVRTDGDGAVWYIHECESRPGGQVRLRPPTVAWGACVVPSSGSLYPRIATGNSVIHSLQRHFIKRSYKTHQVLGSNIRTHLQLSTGFLPTQAPWNARTTSHDGGFLDNDILGRQSVTSARLGLASLAMHLAR